MFKKRIKDIVIGIVLGGIISTSLFGFAEMQSIQAFFNDIKIQINGKIVETGSDKPFLYNGRTYVPTRYVAEGLGATVKWNESSNTVEIDGSNKDVIVNPSQTLTPTLTHINTPTPEPTKSNVEYKYFLDGKELKLDSYPIEKNNEIYSALRTIMESFALKVMWNDEKKSITFSNDTSTTLIMTIDSKEYYLNDIKLKTETPPIVENGRSLISFSLVADVFKIKYEIDRKKHIIYVSKPVSTPIPTATPIATSIPTSIPTPTAVPVAPSTPDTYNQYSLKYQEEIERHNKSIQDIESNKKESDDYVNGKIIELRRQTPLYGYTLDEYKSEINTYIAKLNVAQAKINQYIVAKDSYGITKKSEAQTAYNEIKAKLDEIQKQYRVQLQIDNYENMLKNNTDIYSQKTNDENNLYQLNISNLKKQFNIQ